MIVHVHSSLNLRQGMTTGTSEKEKKRAETRYSRCRGVSKDMSMREVPNFKISLQYSPTFHSTP
jgi:hypothetical protein